MQPAGENSVESWIQLHVQSFLLSKIAEIEAALRPAWTYHAASSIPPCSRTQIPTNPNESAAEILKKYPTHPWNLPTFVKFISPTLVKERGPDPCQMIPVRIIEDRDTSKNFVYSTMSLRLGQSLLPHKTLHVHVPTNCSRT